MGTIEATRLHVSDPRIEEAAYIIYALEDMPSERATLVLLGRQKAAEAATRGESAPHVKCHDCGAPMDAYREDGTPACEMHRWQ